VTVEPLAARIYHASHLTGEFVLRSGRVATEYFDKYLFEADPEVLDSVAAELGGLVPETTAVLADPWPVSRPAVPSGRICSGPPTVQSGQTYSRPATATPSDPGRRAHLDLPPDRLTNPCETGGASDVPSRGLDRIWSAQRSRTS
jgi:hypothetical protein